MAKNRLPPGVYIEEKDAFPGSVVEVATAIPAFIGYTEKAAREGGSLINKPTRITSMAEYIELFGRGFSSEFTLTTPLGKEHKAAITINGTTYGVDYAEGNKAFMYPGIRLFYENGGGACYIVSVGAYEGKSTLAIDKDDLLGATSAEGGLKRLIKEQEPTIVVVPDAVALPYDQCYLVYQAVLEHCAKMQSRVAILDVHDGFQERNTSMGQQGDIIDTFRNNTGAAYLNYGAAYYPWLETTIAQKSEVTIANLGREIDLKSLLPEPAAVALLLDYPSSESPLTEEQRQQLHVNLIATSATYSNLMDALGKAMNLLPPSGAMAGIYTAVDTTRGVWKAPANIGVSGVIKPAVNITQEEQEDLNTHPSGKSINAIRTFPGMGTLVWGARTLDGNSLDWRYINVRRTMIMLEQSIKLALRSYVFEPNDAKTWGTVKSMIENFLREKWQQGALAGAVPEDAFSVLVGLGSTMTSLDILEGRMQVTVKLAILSPAEYMEVTFEQQMQKA
jgi:Bacteriophage tail sheath protein